MTPPLPLVVLLLVVLLGACGGEAPSAPDVSAPLADALPPPPEQPPPDAEQVDAAPLDAPPSDGQVSPDALADAAPDLDGQAPPDAAAVDVAAERCGDLDTDPNNCGACGRRCTFPNATATCARGQCGLAACVRGFADCDGTNSNGCETDTNEAANCGACGNRCPMGGRCTGGRCDTGCPAGLSWCFDVCVDLATGRGLPSQHCGACGRACERGTVCMGGACANPCPAGRLYCDGNIDLAIACVDVAVGRRTATGTEHCGMCGSSCAAPLGCSGGACVR